MATWALLAIWTLLILFAVMSLVNPWWMRDISRPGKDVEARDFTDYGDNCLRNRQYELAVAQYVRALQIKPDFAAAMIGLGVAYFRLGDLDQAEQWLRKSLSCAKSDRATAHFHLAEVMLRRERYDEAIRYYELAIQAGFDPELAYNRQGLAYSKAERWADARNILETALRYQKDVTIGYRNMLFGTTTSPQADSIAREVAQDALARGVREEELAMYDVELIRSLQNADPVISKTTNDLGVAYLRLGDTVRATEFVQEAVKIWPGNTQAQNNLKALNAMQGRGAK